MNRLVAVILMLVLSVASATAGNPIMLIDPTGMEWLDIQEEKYTEQELENIKVYIFYTNDFEKQAKIQYADAEKKYGKGSVALSNTVLLKGLQLTGEI